MLLIRSLFCQQGCDDRTRYASISAGAYLLFIICSAIFYSTNIATITILLLLVAVNTFSTRRRLKDAQLNSNWLFAPTLAFLVTGLIITFIKVDGLYWLLLLPIMCSALLLTYPSKLKQKYILGYAGPLDLSELDPNRRVSSHHSNRIEPTLAATSAQSASFDAESFTKSNEEFTTYETHSDNKQTSQDIGEAVRLVLLKNKNPAIVAAFIVGIIVIALLVNTFTQQDSQIVEQASEKAATVEEVVREHHVALPDNFNVMLSQYQGVIVGWQGDATNEENIWQLATAQGDSSCEYITFNNGNKIRTVKVYSENGGDFYANFSPLDTETLVNNIVFRGSFTLCGYKFSLKGSQAALGKHTSYVDFINY